MHYNAPQWLPKNSLFPFQLIFDNDEAFSDFKTWWNVHNAEVYAFLQRERTQVDTFDVFNFFSTDH